jgi:hypothetical protein
MLLISQTGKIIGTVTDARSGEPLIGANVIIEGTSLGSSTDLDGNILIINVDPGTYRLKTTYVGYQDLVIENIRVSVNLTTEVNFELEEEVLESDAIVVVAERPLINKNITNSNNIISAQEIGYLPLRGIKAIVSQQAGIVNFEGNLYVRGSRLDATAFYQDGVLVNDALSGIPRISAITNAVEEIQFQAGGYSAEYGNATGGIISTFTKVGGETYHLNLELITDNFVPVGTKYLGGYSYGQSESVLTFSGPLIPSNENLRFFVAASNQFERSPQKYYRGIDEKNVFDPYLARASEIPDSVVVDTFDVYYPEGYRVNNHTNIWTVQGNLTWDIKPVTLRFNGSWRYMEGRLGVGIQEYKTRDRAGITEGETITAALKLTHVLGRNSFYNARVTYFDDYYIPEMDPIFRHNITAYGDSIQNAAVGTFLEGDGEMPLFSRAYSIDFVRRVQPWDGYNKQRQTSWSVSANLLYQLGKQHEMKMGVEYRRYEIRAYSFLYSNGYGPVSIAYWARDIGDGDQRAVYSRINHFGYDLYGNRVDEGPQGPKHPVFASFYLQDKLEYADLIINAGLRFDYYFTDDLEYVNPHSITYDANDMIDPSSFREVKPFKQWSPRLGLSFPVTEKTIFHAQYGKFCQPPRLMDIYQTYDKQFGGTFGGGLKPEQMTQYEIGFKQQLGHNFAFDLTMFYKDVKDQIGERYIYAEPKGYKALVNEEFETVKGLEIKMDLRRSNRIAGSVDYTFSDAKGTSPNSVNLHPMGRYLRGPLAYLQQIAPTDFNQTHRGSVILDYRFARNDGGPILQRLGLNALFQFSSGFNYTRGIIDENRPVESFNYSTTPWTYRLDMKLDKSLRIGPVDVNLYLWITNVFNTQNVIGVYPTSGDAYDDGYLVSNKGKTHSDGLAFYGKDKQALDARLYRAKIYNPDFFGPPRQIRLGLRIDY